MPKFSVRGIWQRWRESYLSDETEAEDAITVFTGVPTLYTRLLQGYEAMDSDSQAASASAARQSRLMMCGSSDLPLPIMQQWETITGHRLLERYGMTEICQLSEAAVSVKEAPLANHFQVFRPRSFADDGSSDAEVGELCIKSPSQFNGYWKLPEVTKESFIDDGFFKTGDCARMDEDGYYVILGSSSYCRVLRVGLVVRAILVPAAEMKRKWDEESKPALTFEELSVWAKVKLAPYKIPTRLLLWESLPRNSMGKGI
ncbi:malonate-- ligase [Olea europaea subsp. europaea]|uniref:Malonate-- ligase n=1 Tax=Olea europaea subsp. europaea TaxID=158383 RepID=A0A8S0R6T1_OLEEU|nr:malonate-- ligase [Olea europaea subsp. europaea]